MSKSETELLLAFLDKSLPQKLPIKSDPTLDTEIQMARQSKLVKFQVAGQLHTKHLGE